MHGSDFGGMSFTHVLGLLSVCSNNVLGLLPHTNVCTKLTSSHQRLYEAHKPVILTSHQHPSGLRDAQAVGWASMTTLSSRSPSSLPTRCVENYGGDCRRLFALIYISYMLSLRNVFITNNALALPPALPLPLLHGSRTSSRSRLRQPLRAHT